MKDPLTLGLLIAGGIGLLGLLIRVNRQGEQIRTLGQEVALLRQQLDERLKGREQ